MDNTFQWAFNRVDDIDWTQDKSGIYCLINWDWKTNTVRIDIISDNHKPIISFAGGSDNVRKAVGRWLDSRLSQQTPYRVSVEHAAYIGAELEKADTMRIDYVQDADKRIIAVVTSDNTHLTDSELLEKTERENKKKADEIVEKYNRQMLDEEQYDFMIICDATRFVEFARKIGSVIALACSLEYYLHEQVFLCQAGVDNNILKITNVKEFSNWLNNDIR